MVVVYNAYLTAKKFRAMTMPQLDDIIRCLDSYDVEVQLNAAACLQHLSYQNEENKEYIRKKKAIPALISMLSSKSSTCQFYSASVLRNLSHGTNIQIKNQFLQCGGIEIVEHLLDGSHQHERRLTEALIAILCNVSCNSIFQVLIAKSTLRKVVQCVLLPIIGIRIDSTTKQILTFKVADLSLTYNTLLEFIIVLLKNLSSGSQYIRKQMRQCDGLLDSVIGIIQHSYTDGHFDSSFIENCSCILRNLCYALQEIEDIDYLARKSNANHFRQFNSGSNESGNNTNNNSAQGSHSSKELLLINERTDFKSSNDRAIVNRGVSLLWNEEIVDVLITITNDCYNYSTIEAAIGAIQNLAACDWYRAEEFRINFRKKKGLPSLVLLLTKGPDKVINVILTAFRNLCQNSRNLDLIAKHGLYHLIDLLPSERNPTVKRMVSIGPDNDKVELPEEYLGLDTIHNLLTFLYFMLKSNPLFCREFVDLHCVIRCMFLLKSDRFYMEHLQNGNPKQSENGDKIPVLAANILQMLWSLKELEPYFKIMRWNCEDFCVQTIVSELKSNISCSTKNTPKANSVYYGKPYTKARANKLLPLTYNLNTKQSRVAGVENSYGHDNKESPSRSQIMPSFIIEDSDNGYAKELNDQRNQNNNPTNRNQLYVDREVNLRRRKETHDV